MKYKYSILRLLSHQPQALKKKVEFQNLAIHYNSSSTLRKLKFRRKIYTLLNNAKIDPKHLSAILSKYRLPRNSFFPLFLKMKSDYLLAKFNRSNEKKEYILAQMRQLPKYILSLYDQLHTLEKKINRHNKSPLWNRILFTKSKKQLHTLQKYDRTKWAILFYNFLDELEKEYIMNRHIKSGYKMVSFFLLELDNPSTKINIKKSFRKLSLLHHPDQGGDSLSFQYLNRARDILMK